MVLRSLARLLLAFLPAIVPGLAAAFGLWPPPALTVSVREYVNDHTGHYVLLSDFREIQGVEQGAAGPGWRFTGYTFTAFQLQENGSTAQGAVPVCRFYAPPPTNSHFFTANPEECEFLKNNATGWIYEKTEFKVHVPQGGACTGALTPIYRAYNNRWMFSDSNHRFSSDERVRAKLAAQGWIDEGIAFCAMVGPREMREAFWFSGAETAPSAWCASQGPSGPCMALGALGDMSQWMDKWVPPEYSQVNPAYSPRFAEVTGWLPHLERIYSAYLSEGVETAAARSFVQWVPGGAPIGVHVNGSDRVSGDYAAVSALYRLMPTSPIFGTGGKLLLPWQDGHDHDLFINFGLAVKTIRRDDSASHAYGHPLLDFRDVKSGRHMLVTVQAYGTNPAGDFVAADVKTGHVIVSTAFGPQALFGKTLAGRYISCRADAQSGSCDAPAGIVPFTFRLDTDDFRKVVALARGVDPGLSPRIEDYALDNFQFRNETFRGARVGLEVYGLSATLTY